MILADTSVWVDHLRSGDSAVAAVLASGRMLMHPLVIGEVACGYLRNRPRLMTMLHDLPTAEVASHAEALHFLERQSLAGRGVGYIDVHLVASAMMTDGTRLWTRDRRLAAIAGELGVLHLSGAT